MLEYITENTISDSYIFSMLNQNSLMVSTAQKALEKGSLVTPEQIEEQLIQIKKTQISPIWDRVVRAYENKQILLVYSSEVKVTSAIPFLITRSGNGLCAYVYLSNFTGLSADKKSYDINYKTLYVLMEGAYLSLGYIGKKEYFVRNTGLMKICMNMYTQMYMRLLNKEFALTLDPILSNNTTFLIAKYFVMNVWGMTNSEMASGYAITACLEPDRSAIKEVDLIYDEVGPKDLTGLTNLLHKASDRMAPLTLRYLMERWINTYKQGGLLAMDCLPYLFFAIENLLLGTFVVNQTILRDVMKGVPTVRNFYAEITKAL